LCGLILTGWTPFAVLGDHAAQAMLFPMERLFEDFAASAVAKALPSTWRLQRQPRAHALCRHHGRDLFDLRPDFVARGEGQVLVLDAKWKRLQSALSARYGLSQSDLYQLNAYGQTYLGGRGDLFLIYPLTPEFPLQAEAFLMEPALRLHLLALDLKNGELSADPFSARSEPVAA
jgi:5-methylcytosine-specific restriction enzyme subunit McrC